MNKSKKESVTLSELLIATQTISSYLKESVRFDRALLLTADKTDNKYLKKALNDISQKLPADRINIETPFKNYPDIFPEFYLNILKKHKHGTSVSLLTDKLIKEIQLNIDSGEENKNILTKKNEIYFFKKVSVRELSVFTRSLSILVGIGINYSKSLKTLEKQQTNQYFKSVIKEVSDLIVLKGQKLSAAMNRFPNVFPFFYVTLIETGESTGQLHTVLVRLADQLEKQDKLKSRIYSALTYPAIVLVFNFLLIIGIIKYVLPTFIPIFSGMGQKLPPPTLILIAIVDFFKKPWSLPLIFLFIIVILILFKIYYKSKDGKMAVDKYLYNFPVIGSLLVKISVYKLTYIISLATTSGLTFKHIVRLMIDSADNAYLRKELIDFGEQIRMGETVSNAIERETLLPKNFRVMFSTGYEVGAVIKTMQVLEYYFEHEIDYTIDSLTDLIEPFLFIFLAVVVGGILVSVLLPIYSIMMSLG